MKKFITKTLLFLIPIILLYAFTFNFYTCNKGDLLRLGYVIDLYPDYRSTFSEEFLKEVKFSKVSENPQKKNFKFLTIGDSFSEQSEYGYQNYLAKEFDVLHFDRFMSDNQIQTLFHMIKGDFFDHYVPEYVILQNVERNFVSNTKSIDTTKTLTYSNIISIIDSTKVNSKKQNCDFKFLSNRILKFPYLSFQYFLKEDYIFNDQVIKAKLNRNDLFSINTSELLFFHYDLEMVQQNNNSENVTNLNAVLNRLNTLLNNKGIKLIVLPSPDKYDFYYNFIKNKSLYNAPNFFELLNKTDKEYIYIDSKKNLTKILTSKKDIYFYDDTHWSPWASQSLAKEISAIIGK
tara:strand:+ start:94015 stop:95055 length:1041 start_codon:yes stop_codon:yes gene_type:complete